jgi:hypothetical protein
MSNGPIKINLRTGQYGREVERFIKYSNRQFMMIMVNATNEMHKMAQKKIRQHSSNAIIQSGNLRKRIVPKIYNGGYTGEIVSHASYSQAYEEGQRPHIIRIANKKVLAGPKRGNPGWTTTSGDYAIYGVKVKHPGTEPRPFMYPAWLWGIRKLEDGIKKALN